MKECIRTWVLTRTQDFCTNPSTPQHSVIQRSLTHDRSDSLSQTELTTKLEPAFLSGLRCSDVQLRGRFFAVYNKSIQKRLFDRLLYIMCSQV